MKKMFIAFELVGFVLMGGFLGWAIDEFILPTGGLAPALGVMSFFFLWVFYIWKNFRS